jgi:hypothetical protein
MFRDGPIVSFGRGLMAVLLASGLLGGSAAGAQQPKASSAEKPRMAARFGDLPLGFEANAGQAGGAVKFLARGSGYGLYLCANQAVLALRKPASAAMPRAASDAVRMQLAGADRAARPAAEEPLPGTVNYFVGNDPAGWRTNIPTYAKIRYRAVYPGVDLVYYGNQRQLEYDFAVAPGADPEAIRLRLAGAKRLRLTRDGDLVVTAGHGALAFRKPAIYQLVDGERKPVAGSFKLLSRQTVGFRLGRYDRARPLVIDPVLVYSTYLGGSDEDVAHAIAVDASGAVYVAGQTYSTDFPVSSGAFQTADGNTANGQGNAFIAKLNAAGTALIYSTYLGGSGTLNGSDGATAIAVDGSGNAYVTGNAYSSDFPVTSGAFQTTNKAAANGVSTVFLAKLNATGTALVYSTYLGGSGTAVEVPFSGDSGKAIAVDAEGNAYATGETYSTDFPVTQGAFQTASKAASAGANAFVAKLNPAGTALAYSTYLGGSGNSQYGNPQDSGNAIAIDSAGDAYVAGQAVSTNFPVTPGALQPALEGPAKSAENAFVAELNPAGSGLVYSTYLGGSSSDFATGVAVDTAGDAYVTGSATSTDFPVTQGAYQTTNQGSHSSLSNAFVSKLNPGGTELLYSTYVGGSGGPVWLMPTLAFLAGDAPAGIAVDSLGDAYIAGSTASANFPVTPGAYQTVNNDQTVDSVGGENAFVTELNPAGTGLVYSTYLGGDGVNPLDYTFAALGYGGGDGANGLALDRSGNVYIAGGATSADFPVSQGAFQTTIHSTGNAFVAKLEPGANSTSIVPAVAITPAPPSITSAQPLTVAVSVSGGSGNPVPTGTVKLASGSYSSAAATLVGGSATFNLPAGTLVAVPACFTPLSQDLLTANYIPDAASASTYDFSSVVSSVAVASPCFEATPSSTNLTTAQAQSQALTVTAAGTGGPGNPVPTGSVTLSVGSYTSAAATLSNGNATLTVPAGTLSSGFNTLFVNYLGDSNYAPEPEAGSALVTVGTTTGSGFTLTGTAVTLTAGATTSNASAVTVTPFGNFSGSVALTASITSSPSGAIDPPTLSFGATSPVSTPYRTPGTATLTIATTAASGCTAADRTQTRSPWSPAWQGGAAALACVFLLGFPRRRGYGRLLAGALFLAALAGGAAGCGGGGGSCNTGASGTTPGAYTITVTGASGGTTATTTISLTVTAQ